MKKKIHDTIRKVLLMCGFLLLTMYATLLLNTTAAFAKEGDVVINEKNFPDAEFRKAVSGFDSIKKDGVLSAEELAAVKEFDIGYNGTVSNIKGIEYFTNLEILYCDNNKLTSIDVSKNTNLRSLSVMRNQLTVLNVSNLKKLEILACSGNKLTTLDVSHNPELWLLDCRGNGIKSLDLRKNNYLSEAVRAGKKSKTEEGDGIRYEKDLDQYRGYYLITDEGVSFQIAYLPSGIGVLPDSVTLRRGESMQLTATVVPDDVPDKSVKWASSADFYVEVDDNGYITAARSGSATITATTVNGLVARCEVKVVVFPDKIELVATSGTVAFGVPVTIYTHYYPIDTTERTLKWTIDNEKIATVSCSEDTEGAVVKAKGNGVGIVTVTATTVNGLKEDYVFRVFADASYKNVFADIKSGTWQYDAAKPVYEKGYMTGKGKIDNKVIFSPNTQINRSQFVTSLYSMAGKPAVSYKQQFSDVNSKDWYAGAVTWASKNGITAGNADGTFGVNGQATREQLAVMFYRYAEYMNYGLGIWHPDCLDNFTDADKVDAWAFEAVRWAVDHGIITGKGNEKDGYRIDPLKGATRVECAAMMNKFDEIFSENQQSVLEAEEEPIALPTEEQEDILIPEEEKEEEEEEDIPLPGEEKEEDTLFPGEEIKENTDADIG